MAKRLRLTENQAQGTDEVHHKNDNEPDASATKASFMSLPREIRDQIYKLLIPNMCSINMSEYGRRNAITMEHDGRPTQGIAGVTLLRVSSGINAEFRDSIFDSVFCIGCTLGDGSFTDLDSILPPKPARFHIRFLFVEVHIPDCPAHLLQSPDFTALDMMNNLCLVAVCICLQTQSNPTQPPIQLTAQDFEQNVIINGLVAELMGSLLNVATDFLAMQRLTVPVDWSPVPAEALTRLGRKHAARLKILACKSHRQSNV